MDFKQLKALVTVAEVGSVTRAAEVLYLAQPAVTRQIRALERELGVVLFERTREGMRPTEAGAVVVHHGRRALHALERARADVQPTPGVVTGNVTLGLLESTSDLLVEPLVAVLADEHPGIRLRLVIGYSGHLRQWLDDGDLDLAVLYNLGSTPSLNTHPLLRERLWAVAPASDGLRGDRPIPFAEAADHPLVMPAADHALRTLVDGAAAQAKVELDVAVETNSMRVQKQLVQAGHGWTVLPGVGVAEEVAAGLLSAAPLGDPEVRRSIVLAAPRITRSLAAVNVVARTLIHQVLSAVAEGRWPSAQARPPHS
ncbi:LysR substrate-binding domain-containing protein [Actinomadura rugatobispora]|uniref:LysR substrate-binding domain-containing protein n=1 Tax=Actinomadura rugatobispora TaxID=1994 RepID=A0ABW1AF28_9ACTN|nr:LysR substrate-binding domain-containing protein [Actinomadura rugatobispora]